MARILKPLNGVVAAVLCLSLTAADTSVSSLITYPQKEEDKYPRTGDYHQGHNNGNYHKDDNKYPSDDYHKSNKYQSGVNYHNGYANDDYYDGYNYHKRDDKHPCSWKIAGHHRGGNNLSKQLRGSNHDNREHTEYKQPGHVGT